jgi:hypothetical protein
MSSLSAIGTGANLKDGGVSGNGFWGSTSQMDPALLIDGNDNTYVYNYYSTSGDWTGSPYADVYDYTELDALIAAKADITKLTVYIPNGFIVSPNLPSSWVAPVVTLSGVSGHMAGSTFDIDSTGFSTTFSMPNATTSGSTLPLTEVVFNNPDFSIVTSSAPKFGIKYGLSTFTSNANSLRIRVGAIRILVEYTHDGVWGLLKL